MLEVNPGLTIWTIVIFLTLLIILKKYAYKPITNLIKKQEETIRGAIERAAKLNLEAEERKKEAEKLIEHARVESRKIMEQTLRKAERIEEEIIENAKREAKSIIENAKKETALEKEKFHAEMERIILEISGDVAEKILERKITDSDNKKLVDEALKRIENLMS